MSKRSATFDDDEILELKTTLEHVKSPQKSLLQALHRLKLLGPLPVDVLKRTMIGKSVKSLTTKTPYQEVRLIAQQLEQDWRRAYREWLAGVNGVRQDLKETDAPQPKKARQGAHDSDHSSLAENASTSMRETVRRLLSDVLTKCHDTIPALEAGVLNSTGSPKTKDPKLLAAEIENALHVHYKANEKAYRAQARAVCFNLKDEKNVAFRLKLMLGYLIPEKIPTLTAEDMASDQKRALRTEIRREAMEAVDAEWDSRHTSGEASGMFPCELCQSLNTTNFEIPAGKPDVAPTIVVICLACGHRSNIQDKQC